MFHFSCSPNISHATTVNTTRVMHSCTIFICVTLITPLPMRLAGTMKQYSRNAKPQLAMIAPLLELREIFAQRLGADYHEVWCSASLVVCEQRDPKGHYARARRGDLAGFTGVSAPYQSPLTAALVLDTGGQSVEACLQRLLTWLGDCAVLPAP